MVDDPQLQHLWQQFLQKEAQQHTAAAAQGQLPPGYHRHRWLWVKEEIAYIARQYMRDQRNTKRVLLVVAQPRGPITCWARGVAVRVQVMLHLVAVLCYALYSRYGLVLPYVGLA
jgi:hypothetical protein